MNTSGLTTLDSTDTSGGSGGTGGTGDPDLPEQRIYANTPAALTTGRCLIELLLDVPEMEPPLHGWFERRLARAAALMGIDVGTISVSVVGEQRMTQLHEQYLGESSSTDVLTFDLRDDPSDPLEGDLVLCLDEALHHAARCGHQTREELLLYAIHGMLHLVGHEDGDSDSAAQMHQRENAILTKLGIGPIYGTTS